MTERKIYMKTKKVLYLIVFILLIVTIGANIDFIKSGIIDNSNSLKLLYKEHFYAFILTFLSSYILLTSLSIPVALLMGLLAGFVMDLLVAIVIVSFASSIGATISMLLVRYFFSDYVARKYSKQFNMISCELKENGPYYLFALRMSPIFPFFIINVCFGLTNIKTSLFYFFSQLGMLPGTILIIMIGNELSQLILLDSPFSINLILYLTVLGLLPLIFKKYVKSS